MRGWQAVGSLLLLGRLVAGEPAVGEAGLAALAEARAGVQAVGGSGLRTVGRSDGAGDTSEERRLDFQVAIDGRYFAKLVPADDPEGEREVWISDGSTTRRVQKAAADDDHPIISDRPAGDADLIIRRLLACVRLDLAQLRRDYAVALAADAAGLRRLTLVPSDPALARDIAQVVVLIDAASRPVRVVVDEANGTRQTVRLTAFQDDPPLDPVTFVITR